MLSHPPEPWEAVNYENEGDDDDWTIDHAGHGSVVSGLDEITARRIAACVNACKGVPTEVLETTDPLTDLLAACKFLMSKCRGMDVIEGPDEHEFMAARAVIAETEGLAHD